MPMVRNLQTVSMNISSGTTTRWTMSDLIRHRRPERFIMLLRNCDLKMFPSRVGCLSFIQGGDGQTCQSILETTYSSIIRSFFFSYYFNCMISSGVYTSTELGPSKNVERLVEKETLFSTRVLKTSCDKSIVLDSKVRVDKEAKDIHSPHHPV